MIKVRIFNLCTVSNIFHFICDVSECSSGWEKLGSKCYKLFTTEQNWISSKKECLKANGSLVATSENLYYTMLHSLMKADVKSIWSGHRNRAQCTILRKYWPKNLLTLHNDVGSGKGGEGTK